MLDRGRLISLLTENAHLFEQGDISQWEYARELWERAVQDPLLPEIAKNSSHLTPRWHGAINTVINIEKSPTSYVAVGVDGSQVYPDRHLNISCALIHVGALTVFYGEKSSAQTYSEPHLINYALDIPDTPVSSAIVDATRLEYELRALYELGKSMQSHNLPYIVMADGTLIFWAVSACAPEIRDRYITRYLLILEQLYRAQIPTVFYISMPKSRELVHVLSTYAQHIAEASPLPDKLLDTHIISWFVPINSITQMYASAAEVVRSYSAHLAPYYCYLHCEEEVVRIEMPQWMTQHPLLNEWLALVVDQIKKGRGYPVVLAEAHENAVVTGADRQFFIDQIDALRIRSNIRTHNSCKVMRKRYASF